MKRKFLLTFALIFVLLLAVSLTSCLSEFEIPGLALPGVGNSSPGSDSKPSDGDGSSDNPSGGNTDNPSGGNTDNPSGGNTDNPSGGNPGNPPVDTPETPPADAPEYFQKVTYVYVNGGTQDQFFTQMISSKTLFDETAIAARDEEIRKDFGFKFVGYYYDKEMTRVCNFDKIPKEGEVENMPIYCERDFTKAGDNITYNFDAVTGTLSFSGTGEMYDFASLGHVPWADDIINIEEVIIPEGITSLAAHALQGCENITSVEFPSTLEKIYKNAFFEATSLTEVNFPDSLKSIGEDAYSGCNQIKHITFNDNLEFIGPSAFKGCTELTSIVLTDAVVGVGHSAFTACEKLCSVYYKGTSEEYSLIELGFRNLELTDLSQTWFLSQDDPGVAGPYWYFDNNGDVAQWSYAIWYLKGDNLNVPMDKNDIKEGDNIKPDLCVDFVRVDGAITADNVEYANSLTYHGYRFDGYYLRTGNKTDMTKHYVLEVGKQLTSDIKLVGDRGKICGDNLVFEYSGTTLTIKRKNNSNADGAMWNFESATDAPWHGYNIRTVNIEDGVTSIGSYAFCNINDDKLQYNAFSWIEIPVSVKSFGEFAFTGNNYLLYIFYMGDKAALDEVTGVNELVFTNGCKVYANANNVSDLTSLGEGAYWKENIVVSTTQNNTGRMTWAYDSTSKTLTIGAWKGVMLNYGSMEERPWHHYIADGYIVENVAILGNVTTIGHYTVKDFTNVVSITLPTKLEHDYRISASAFVGTAIYNEMYNSEDGVVIFDRHLIAVNPLKQSDFFIIPINTLSIAMDAFKDCSSITKLVMQTNLATDIASNSLEGLTSLNTIFFYGTNTMWNDYINGSTASHNVLKGATVYYYSATQPTTSGNYFKVENNEYKIW